MVASTPFRTAREKYRTGEASTIEYLGRLAGRDDSATGADLRGGKFSYDAAEDRKRRRAPRYILQSEDAELDREKRRKLVATGHDLPRNVDVAKWAIGKHLDYVSTFHFQSRNEDTGLNRAVEDFVAWWSKKENLDVARRHPRRRFLRLAEACRTIAGDLGVVRLQWGQIQAIEGDRIRDPVNAGYGDQLPSDDDLVHGVQINQGTGAAQAYAVHKRDKWGRGFVFDRMIPARFCYLHGYWDPGRFDQVRGISPLASALNRYQDLYENFDYALALAKVQQLFGMVIYSPSDDAVGQHTVSEEGTDEDTGKDDKYDVDFGRGPFKLELEDGDKAEFLNSAGPSQGFKEFTEVILMCALRALDIPYSFLNESFTNYSGARQALLLYEQSAQNKREDNVDLLNWLIGWRIALAVIDGDLVLPRKMRVSDLKWEWIHTGLPWIDPMKEVAADDKAVSRSFDSTIRVCRRRGVDAYELVDEEAAFEKYRRDRRREILGEETPTGAANAA